MEFKSNLNNFLFFTIKFREASRRYRDLTPKFLSLKVQFFLNVLKKFFFSKI